MAAGPLHRAANQRQQQQTAQKGPDGQRHADASSEQSRGRLPLKHWDTAAACRASEVCNL